LKLVSRSKRVIVKTRDHNYIFEVNKVLNIPDDVARMILSNPFLSKYISPELTLEDRVTILENKIKEIEEKLV